MNFLPLKQTILFAVITLLSISRGFPSATEEKIAALEREMDGHIGVYAINTANNQQIQHRAQEHFPIQSTFKTMAIAALLKKSISDKDLLQQKMTYDKKEMVFWSPMTEKHLNDGMTLFDLCAAAMMYSDNTATNLIVKKLGGPQAVTAFARSIGDDTFRIEHWEPELNSNPKASQDSSTPLAMGKSLQKITLENVLSAPQRAQIITWMKGNTTGDTRIRAGIPKGWIVADKTGSSNDYGISNDIAVIWPPNCAPIVVAIYSVHNKKDSTRRDDVIALITKTVMNEFAQTDKCIQQEAGLI